MIANDDTRRVDAGIAGEILQDHCGIDQLPGDFLALVSLLEIRRLLERLRQIHFQVSRDHLGQPVAVSIRQSHHAADIPHHALRPHRAKRDNLGDGIVPIFFADIFDDIRSSIVGKIDVDIRWIDALGVQKALEQQPVADGVHVRNLQQVGHDRTGGGTARHAGNTLATTVANKIADNQKIGDKPGFFDDPKFELQTVNDRLDRSSDGGIFEQFCGIRLWIPAGCFRLEVSSRWLIGGKSRRVINASDDEFFPLRLGMNRVAGKKALGQPLAQKSLTREMFGRMKNRVMQLAKLDVEVAFLGHLKRVFDRVWRFGKARLHLVGAAQIKLLRHITGAHALGVAQQILGADADQTVVRMRIALVDVVNVVGGDELEVEFLAELDQLPVYLGLLGQTVILQFKVEILRAERLPKPIHRRARLVDLVFHDQIRDFAGETARHGNQALAVGSQNLLVDPRLIVINVEMCRRGQLDQVFVARLVAREQAKMVIKVPGAASGFFLQPRAGSNVDLTADDWFDAFIERRPVKVDDPVHGAVIGDRERGKFQFMRLLHQLVQTAGTIEQRILGVQMEVDKISVRRHRSNLPREVEMKQETDVHPGRNYFGMAATTRCTGMPARQWRDERQMGKCPSQWQGPPLRA